MALPSIVVVPAEDDAQLDADRYVARSRAHRGGWEVSLTGAVGILRIPYITEEFPTGTVTNGYAELSVTWDDILWAAVTVGRPNRHYVFRHGAASMYEALFRWSLVRMALEQSGPSGFRLRRTTAAKTLDPTEKGAVNYFLGIAFCKLFAAKLLNSKRLAPAPYLGAE